MYIGGRSCKCDPMFDLGVKYFSSSQDKEFMKDQKDNPESYGYQILEEFEKRKEATGLEIELHKHHEVGKNELFYNRSKQTSIGWDTTGTKASKETRKLLSSMRKGEKNIMFGKTHSEEVRKKISKGKKGKKLSEEHKIKIGKAGKGRVLSIETKKKMSEAKKGIIFSEESRRKMSESQKGKKLSKETKKKMSEARKGEKNGFFGKAHSEESRKKMSDCNKGKIRINNGIENKTIDPKDMERFVKLGYSRGVVRKKK